MLRQICGDGTCAEEPDTPKITPERSASFTYLTLLHHTSKNLKHVGCGRSSRDIVGGVKCPMLARKHAKRSPSVFRSRPLERTCFKKTLCNAKFGSLKCTKQPLVTTSVTGHHSIYIYIYTYFCRTCHYDSVRIDNKVNQNYGTSLVSVSSTGVQWCAKHVQICLKTKRSPWKQNPENATSQGSRQ